MKLLDDKIFYPLAVFVAALMIVFSLAWPQGLGTRSPPPFGHAEILPDYYRMDAERTARQKREAEEKARRLADQAVTDSSAAASDTPTGDTAE